jgi:hypothetical protein
LAANLAGHWAAPSVAMLVDSWADDWALRMVVQ